MKFQCPHCGRYSPVDLDKKPRFEKSDTIDCELCKKKSVMTIRALSSRSIARRIFSMLGIDKKDEDLDLYVKEGGGDDGKNPPPSHEAL